MTDSDPDRAQSSLNEPDTAKKYWTTEELLSGQKEIQIVHGTETYRLRITRNGKLLLQK